MQLCMQFTLPTRNRNEVRWLSAARELGWGGADGFHAAEAEGRFRKSRERTGRRFWSGSRKKPAGDCLKSARSRGWERFTTRLRRNYAISTALASRLRRTHR